jgi:hypothetical protein
MGIIGMKVFADGAMYTKPATWSNTKEHVVRSVGDANLPSKPLIQYALTTHGVHLVIIGIGQVSDEKEKCQLTNNLEASQVLPDGLNESERIAIEEMAKKSKNGMTNYFQTPALALAAPKEVFVNQLSVDNTRKVVVGFSTAYAFDAPLSRYEIWRDGSKVHELPFTPQLTTDPITWTDTANDNNQHKYIVKVVDGKGRVAESSEVVVA